MIRDADKTQLKGEAPELGCSCPQERRFINLGQLLGRTLRLCRELSGDEWNECFCSEVGGASGWCQKIPSQGGSKK